MHTFSLQFLLKKQKARKDGAAPLYLRITVNRKRVELSLKRYLFPAEWDEHKEKPNGRSKASKELDTYLNAVRTKLYRHHREMLDRDEPLSAIALKDAFLGKNSKHIHSVLSVYRFHNQQLSERVGQDYAKATLARYSTGLKHVAEFIQYHYQRADLPLYKLDHPFITNFDHYLRTVRKINNNTTVKYVSLFRKIVRLAIRNGWLEKDPFLNYEGKHKTVDREYLDQEELQRLKDKSFAIPRLEQVKDVFLFACYTGLAHVDMSKLNEDHIIRDVEGDYWIKINRTKTDTRSMIPLLPPALALIEKYRDSPERLIKGQLLPVKSNQKVNAYLKEVADLCNIRKHLTFHMARHTFATTVTLSNGVPIETVSSMLGHRNIKTTQHYAKIVQRKVREVLTHC